MLLKKYLKNRGYTYKQYTDLQEAQNFNEMDCYCKI